MLRAFVQGDFMRIIALLALALGLSGAQAANTRINAFECFTPGQNADVALYSRDLRGFTLSSGGKSTRLKLKPRVTPAAPKRLVFKGASVELTLDFEKDNGDHAEGVLTGLADADVPVHWLCARQLFGP